MTGARTLVALVPSTAARRRLTSLARALHLNLRVCRAARDALHLISACSPVVLIAAPADARGRPTAPLLARVRRESPALGVVLLLDRRLADPVTLAALRHADRVLFAGDLEASTLWTAVYMARAERRRASPDWYTSGPTYPL